MKTTRTFLCVLLTTLTLVGCAGHVRFQSNPNEASVELISNDNRGATLVGQTPLMLDKVKISSLQKSGPYIFRITREGFAPREITIASLTGLQLDYNVDLKPIAMSPKTNLLVNELFAAQNLAQQHNYEEALNKLDVLQKDFPEIVAIYEMRGSIYMIKGQYALANKEFKRAITLDPENKELQAMLEASVKRAVPTSREVSSEKRN